MPPSLKQAPCERPTGDLSGGSIRQVAALTERSSRPPQAAAADPRQSENFNQISATKRHKKHTKELIQFRASCAFRGYFLCVFCGYFLCAFLWLLPLCLFVAKDQARRRPVRVKLPGLVDDPSFGRGRTRTGMHYLRFTTHTSCLSRHRADEVNLDLERGVTRSGRQFRMNRTTHGGIEQRSRESAMDHANRVVMIFIRIHSEHSMPFAHLH